MKIAILFTLFLLGACEKSGSNSEAHASEIVPSGNSASTPTTSVSSSAKTQMIDEFMTLINNHRDQIGLDPLEHVSGLGDIAEAHSRNMANGSVSFGHSGFSSRCSAGREVIGGANLCAENVASGQKNVQAAFSSWMNSSGHKANIEQGRSTHTGFGFYKNASGTIYWTQIFLERN